MVNKMKRTVYVVWFPLPGGSQKISSYDLSGLICVTGVTHNETHVGYTTYCVITKCLHSNKLYST